MRVKKNPVYTGETGYMPEPGELNCCQFLEKATEQYGDVTLLQHLDERYYRSEMLRDADAVAAYMQQQLGLKRGDVYSIFMPTTPQSIISFYALNSIGVIVNFIHPLLPPAVVKEILLDVNSKGVMVLDILSTKHTKMINELNIPCVVCSSSDYASALKGTALRIPEAAVRGIAPKFKNRISYRRVISSYHGAKRIDDNGGDIAVYLNGGGTTGKSKTIMLTSKAINELVKKLNKIDKIEIPGEEAEVVVLPLFHCFGLCVAVHMALCNSARIIPLMQFDAKLFNRLIRKNYVVGFGGIPIMFRKLMKDKKFDCQQLANIRMCFCGGDDVSQVFIDDFNACLEKHGASGRLREGYGLTETGSVCTVNTNTEFREGSIGKALHGLRVEIWDEDHRRVPNGTVGEIAVSGSTIMAGYYTKGCERGDGLYTDEDGVKWVLSGDLGRQDDDGYFFFCGRKKRVIIISGYNVYPSDIEKALGDLPYVKDVCLVRGWKDGKPIIRCFVSFKGNGDVDGRIKEMLKLTEEKFSGFSVPRDVIVLNELPQTPLMKIDFMKLTQNNTSDPVYKG